MGARYQHWPLWILLVFSSPVLAQVETARITGKLTDSSGAVIAGATITITHLRTNRQVVAVTNNEGTYLSVSLPIGDYRVEAQLPGFKQAVRSGIRLEVQKTAVVDFTLEIGELSEHVEVKADAPLLNTSEATQGQVIDNQKMVGLPLNGRDYLQLALLSAGALQSVGGAFGGFSAGGQRTSQNNYLLDGIDNNNVQIHGQGRAAGRPYSMSISVLDVIRRR